MWGQRVQEAPEGLLVSPITGHCGGKMVPLELGRGPRADTKSAEAWISDPPQPSDPREITFCGL